MSSLNFGIPQVFDRILNNSRIACSVFVLLFALLVQVQLTQLINHDTGWYLHSVQAFLNGGNLYENVFWEVNPPLAFYLSIPPVWLGLFVGGSIIHWFVFYVCALLFITIILVNEIFRNVPNFSPSTRRWIIFLILFALGFSPGEAFGQREHFTMILTMPYIILSICRTLDYSSKRPCLEVVIGVLGALGFSMKPHFLLIPVVIEIYLFFQWKQFSGIVRNETIALITTSGLYGLIVLVMTPEYLSTVMPYAWVVYNNAYKNNLILVLSRVETLLLPAVCLLHYFTRHKQHFPKMTDVFLCLAVCFFCVYLIQMKGWSYHIYPVAALLLMAVTAMILGEFFRQPPQNVWNKKQVISQFQFILIIGLMALMVFIPLRQGGYTNPFMKELIPIVEKYAHGKPIYIFSSNVWTGFPLVNYTEVQWVSRFPTLWLIPGLIQARAGLPAKGQEERRAILEDIERFSTDAVLTDITKQSPALIIVDIREHKSYFGDLEFDYIDYFSTNVKFATLWSKYQHLVDVQGFAVYRKG